MADQDPEALRALGTEPAVAWEAAPARGQRAGWAAILAVAIGFGGLGALALTEGLIGNVGTAVPLDPGIDELGLAVRVGEGVSLPPVLVLFGAIAMTGLVALVGRGRRVGRALGIVGLALLAFAGFAAWNLSPVSNDQTTRLWGDGIGHTRSSTSSLTPWSEYDVGPGEPATFAFAVRNDGPLPVTILGYADDLLVDLGFRVVGLGSLPPSEADRTDGRPPQMDAAVIAWPIRLDPGSRLILVVVGRGGPCAAGAQRAEAESATLVSHIELAYRLAGWTRVAEVDLPNLVTVPTNLSAC